MAVIENMNIFKAGANCILARAIKLSSFAFISLSCRAENKIWSLWFSNDLVLHLLLKNCLSTSSPSSPYSSDFIFPLEIPVYVVAVNSGVIFSVSNESLSVRNQDMGSLTFGAPGKLMKLSQFI